MDIRKKVGKAADTSQNTAGVKFEDEKTEQSFNQELTQEEKENLANVAIYNLAKKKTLYSEMSSEYTEYIKYGTRQRFLGFFVVYSYKPFIYLGLAAIFQLLKRRLTAVDIFIHASIWMTINQYEYHQGLKLSHATQMQEYEQASANYERALYLQKFSFFNYIKNRISLTITPADFVRAMEARVY